MNNTEESTTNEASRESHVIKRYTNRKLYDTVESRYVTLEEISELIRAGTEVKIIDNKTKEDLTSVTLTQIILEEEKKKSKMPLAMLRDIIRHGGETLSGFLHHKVDHVGQRMAFLKGEAGGLRERLWQKLEENKPLENVKPLGVEQAIELFVQNQRRFEEWQKRIDERVRSAVEDLTSLPSLAKNMAALEQRIASVEKMICEYEKQNRENKIKHD